MKLVLNGLRNVPQCASDIFKWVHVNNLMAVSSSGQDLGLFPCLGYFE